MMSDNEISNNLTNSQLYGLLVKVIKNQTEELKAEINKNIQDLSKKVDSVESKVETLQNKILSLERRSRRNNVIIFGMNVDKLNLLNNSLEFLNKTLGTNLQRNEINNIYLGGNKTKDKHHIVIEFISYLQKQSIFKNIGKLKNSGVAIVNDMCFEDRQTQRVLKDHLKNAKSQNHQVKIKGSRLEIDGKLFTLEDLKKLEEEASEEEFSESEEEQKEESPEKIESTETIVKRRRHKISYSPPNERNLRSRKK